MHPLFLFTFLSFFWELSPFKHDFFGVDSLICIFKLGIYLFNFFSRCHVLFKACLKS